MALCHVWQHLWWWTGTVPRLGVGESEPWYAKGAKSEKADPREEALEFVSKALAFKEAGNAPFKNGENETAVSEYGKGIATLADWERKAKDSKVAASDSDSDDEKENRADDSADDFSSTPAGVEVREVKVSLHLNSAMALLKLERWEDAISSSTSALAEQPENVKALYRRGVAKARSGMLEGAVTDLQAAIKLEPTNREAKRELARLTDKVRARRLEEKPRVQRRATAASCGGLSALTCAWSSLSLANFFTPNSAPSRRTQDTQPMINITRVRLCTNPTPVNVRSSFAPNVSG